MRAYIDGDKLEVELLEGFSVMAHEELQVMYGMEYADMWGARDELRHAVLAVIWKDSGEFITKLASEKSLAKRVEKALSKRYRSSGYRRADFFESRIAEKTAYGFRYTFQPEGIPHECEVSVFKNGARCYTLYYYTRQATAQDNRPVYEGVLASLELS